MRAAVPFTAFTVSIASLTRQRRANKRRQAASYVPALFLVAVLSGCAGVDVLMLSSETFPPQAGGVQVLERAPARPYAQIAVLTVDSWWLSVDARREKIVQKAQALGADAVVFGAVGLPSPPPGNRTVEEAAPDDLHSSLQEEVPDGDARMYLVRGGGHGGGRGGGHHRGFGGGRSGHHGARHWRHFSSPGFGMYGFYGPGWWGYGPPYWGPYWGGYYPYPYYGGYPAPDYGYMNNLTVGTAIRYTD